MVELKNCPLCGEEVEYLIIPHYYKSVAILEQHVIRCRCGLTTEARVSPTTYKHDEIVQEFIDNWNHRTMQRKGETNETAKVF